jgi:hypothetical protein
MTISPINYFNSTQKKENPMPNDDRVWDSLKSLINDSGRSLTVLEPSGVPYWKALTIHNITWNSTGIIPYVKIELFKRGNHDRTIYYNTTNDGRFSWIVPDRDIENSTEYQIKILDANDPSIYSFSEFFEITAVNSINVDDRNPDYQLNTGEIFYIKWSSSGWITHVNIDLYRKNKFLFNIKSGIPNVRRIAWWIDPIGMENSSFYQFKITDYNNTALFDFCDNFTILNSPGVTVIRPTWTDVWRMGSSYNITWNSTGIVSRIDIHLFRDGKLKSVIVNDLRNEGFYTWTVPKNIIESDRYEITIHDSRSSAWDDGHYFEIKRYEIIPGIIPAFFVFEGMLGIVLIVMMVLMKYRYRRGIQNNSQTNSRITPE